MSGTSYFLIGCIFLSIWIYIFTRTISSDFNETFNDDLSELADKVDVLQRLLDHERSELNRVREHLEEKRRRDKVTSTVAHTAIDRSWKEPIPILVFACNRPLAVKNHLNKLIRLRPSAERFPIIVTQDCDNDPVRSTVASYGDKVKYIKHVSGEKANITVPFSHNQYTAYYRIARHYKLALNYVFNQKGYSSVVITEDDLDIADDFFEYFSATRYLLDEDPLLWCVSAWNDNGKAGNIDESNSVKLYRSDFFSGLGWMMTRSLWDELNPIWPSGFWDDWLRDPLRRKGRQCIRPEISRTGMTTEGKKGASKGQFFNKHLAKIIVNRRPVNFTRTNLDYLLQVNYDPFFENEVFVKSKLVGIEKVGAYTLNTANRNTTIRVEYVGNVDYIEKADKLHIMHDFKAGVPRTAYKGVVSCFINGVRIYLAPDRSVIKEYNPQWEVPSRFGE